MQTASSAISFPERLSEVAARIETTLDRLLSPEAGAGEILRPARLLESMRYATLGGGKRLRPFLVVETARLLGAEGDNVLRAAAAIEMVHCYSLVHDDLPGMDNDDLRRGRPTVHKAFDEATAILAGDGLLTYAFDVIASEPTHADGAVRAALACGLARAAGLGGMAGGQALDLAAETATAPLSAADIQRLQSMKTGALLCFSVEAGAIIAGADAKARAALLAYGRCLGAAFQVADDILDAEGDEAQLGKRAGKDAGRNKATLVAALGLAEAKVIRDRLANDAVSALAETHFSASRELLVEAARFAVARKN